MFNAEMETKPGDVKFDMPGRLPRGKVLNALGNTRYEISVARLWRAVRMGTLAFIKETMTSQMKGTLSKVWRIPGRGVSVLWGPGARTDIHSHGSTVAHEGVKPEKRC